jgi:uncharacterized membrane protein YhiD involved in acid resistance
MNPQFWPIDLAAELTILRTMLPLALLAALCGGAVGLERELRDKPAGLKTNALICLSAAMYVYLGELLTVEGNGDPTRIPGQVITGMGFLGAGAIIRDGGSVLGLTTAATLWTVTAIGLFIGTGHFTIAIVLTITTIAVLTMLRVIERMIAGPCELHDGQVVLGDAQERTRSQLLQILQSYEPSRSNLHFASCKDTMVLTFRYCTRHESHRRVLTDLWQIEGVKEICSPL